MPRCCHVADSAVAVTARGHAEFPAGGHEKYRAVDSEASAHNLRRLAAEVAAPRLLRALLQLRTTGGDHLDDVDQRSSSRAPSRRMGPRRTTVNALITRISGPRLFVVGDGDSAIPA
jgi:hypothetical protein